MISPELLLTDQLSFDHRAEIAVMSLHKLLHTLPIAGTHFISCSKHIENLVGLSVCDGHSLPAEEALQVSSDSLSFALVSDHMAELRQGAVYHLETQTP